MADVVLNTEYVQLSVLSAEWSYREGPGLCRDKGGCWQREKFRPELFVIIIGVPFLMDMEGCMASTDSPAHNSVDFYEGCFFSGMVSLGTQK